MPSGLIIVLMLVLWLVVLAPWLLRSQRPMSHTGEGFDETRVLFEGDSGRVQSRRPRMTEAQMRRVQHASAQPVDAEDEYEVVTADVDDEDILSRRAPTPAPPPPKQRLQRARLPRLRRALIPTPPPATP